jgi:hypothetical protein
MAKFKDDVALDDAGLDWDLTVWGWTAFKEEEQTILPAFLVKKVFCLI